MPENAAVRLEEMIRISVRAKMGQDDSGELDAMPLNELLIYYLNWAGRLVDRRPRRAHLSPALTDGPEYRAQRNLVDAIVVEIETGEDLTPRLSKRIEQRYIPSAKRQSSRNLRHDLDLLLADWRIHHLHISGSHESDGFVKRGSELLFVRFEHDDAYLIQLLDHTSWTDRTLLEICVRAWPQAHLFPSLGGLRQVWPTTDQELTDYRNAGMVTAMEVDGVLYMPPGQSLAGMPNDATEKSNELMRRLHEWERAIELGHDAAGGTWVAHEQPGTGRFGFLETTTGEFRKVVGMT